MDDKLAWWRLKGYEFAREINPTKIGDWDRFFMDVAKRVALMSKCASRKIGAVIVNEESRQILSLGYNGAPAGVDLCQKGQVCPRRSLGIPSGQGIELCPAQHAEENAIANAAKLGVSVEGATMYAYCGVPCQKCMGAIINSGIYKVVLAMTEIYDELSIIMADEARIKLVFPEDKEAGHES